MKTLISFSIPLLMALGLIQNPTTLPHSSTADAGLTSFSQSSTFHNTTLPFELKLPALFQDHLVLQQQSTAPIWGWGVPGSVVTLQPSWIEPVQVSVTEQGTWTVAIQTLSWASAPGPHQLTISSEGRSIQIQDILFGEVWLASGQSNMEMPLRGWPPSDPIANSDAEIAYASNPLIRMFTVRRAVSFEPATDVKGEWRTTTPEHAADFSATAYFFARELHNEVGVPIGIVHSSWGGTPAESWTPLAVLPSVPGYESIEDEIADAQPQMKAFEQWLSALPQRSIQELRARNPERPFVGLDLEDRHLANLEEEDSEWLQTTVPSSFESVFGEFDGIVWYRKSFTLSQDQINAIQESDALELHLGAVDDMDVAYLNGTLIGGMETEGNWQVPRVYTFPATLLRTGKNVLSVRVLDTQGGGGIRGSEPVTIARNDSPWVLLDGEWKAKPIAIIRDDMIYRYGENETSFEAMPSAGIQLNQYSPAMLFHGMIAPLIPFKIRGAIWYQGESNVGRGVQYQTLFRTMIQGWREAWDQGDYPFYYVQIAPYNYDDPSGDATAELREAQRLTLQTENTGMVVTTDIGNPVNIHPANKQEVGRRLSLWALSKEYEKDRVYTGPLFREMQQEGNHLILQFDFVNGGFTTGLDATTNRKFEPIRGFEIAGADGVYYPATAQIDGATIRLHSESVSSPILVRYGWAASPDLNLFNGVGLPASPFQAGL
jgi:sialate O-acetylesterase